MEWNGSVEEEAAAWFRGDGWGGDPRVHHCALRMTGGAETCRAQWSGSVRDLCVG